MGRHGTASLSVDRLWRRLRRLAPAVALLVAASLLVGDWVPAWADPPLPPGASRTAPAQRYGSVATPASVPAEASQGRRGAGVRTEPTRPVAPYRPAPGTWRPLGDAPVAAGKRGYQEGVSKEDISARTAYTTEYVNPDGTRTRRIYENIEFVPDPSGQLKRLDTTLATRTGTGRLTPAATLGGISFAPTTDARDLARLDLGDGVSVGFGLDGAPATAASLDGKVARYRGVRRDADLELTALTTGFKDTIVLRSAAAPTSWVFPLVTQSVTPVLDKASRSVRFIDRHGNIAAVIPPGYMVDSSFDQRIGAPARSNKVTYTLLQSGQQWSLRIDLDPAWLADPSRVFPVRVDPPMQYAPEDDDTFTSSRDNNYQDNSWDDELLVGTYDWGGEVSASFMHIDGALADLANKSVLGSSLYLVNKWSWSCTPAPVSLHRVTQPWWGPGTTTWPGPAYETTALSTLSFAMGYYGCPDWGWAAFGIDPYRINAWARGLEPFYGLTLQASPSDAHGWKRFFSRNAAEGLRPFLDVWYTTDPPAVQAISPEPYGVVDTLRPTLWAAIWDPSGSATRNYRYQICPSEQAPPEQCHSSDWSPSPAFVPPAGWVSGWGEQQWWKVAVSNGITDSGWLGPWAFTPVVPQPGVTGHLAGAPEGAEVDGVNPQFGNYSTTVTDATVAAVGPPLRVTRTYNSQDLRTNGAFGPGWSTPWDQRLEPETDPDDGSVGNVVVTLATGLQVRFGKNADGTYSPPQGQNLSLVHTLSPSRWTLGDSTGTTRVFNESSPARLISQTDADGRQQTYTYDGSGQLSTVTNSAANRALHVTWSGGRIASVATDAPGGAQATPTWTYTYTGGKLTKVCTPLSATSCTQYTYTNSSHYRSAVLDDSPTGYWPLGEASGATTAVNVAARAPGFDGTYTSVGLGTAGALAGSPDTAATFDAASGSTLTLPERMVSTAESLGVDLWFRAGAGSSGVLFGEQSADATQWNPMIYIGTDGKLRGMAPATATPGVVRSDTYPNVNLCYGAEGGSSADGTAIVAQTCNGSAAQSWVRYPDNTLRVLGKCMDAYAWGTDDMTPLLLYTCHGGANQVFVPTWWGGIYNPWSNRCVDKNGVPAVLYGCMNYHDQNWSMPPVLDPITDDVPITDGNWHHVALSASSGQQTLYLDGAVIGSINGPVVEHRWADRAFVGNGKFSPGWAGAPANPYAVNFGFTGDIDDVAFYRHPLAQSQVLDHMNARAVSTRMTTVVEPGSFTAANLTYDHATGRLTSVLDRHGATWTISQPDLVANRRRVTIQSPNRGPIVYSYDTIRNGRLMERTEAGNTRTLSYDDDGHGFLKSVVDENGDVTGYETDERGNITVRITCRDASTPIENCPDREYYGYHVNAANKLDPANDVRVWSADARSTDATDTRYRTESTLNGSGQVTQTTYPKPAGQAARPTESNTYTPTGGAVPAGLLASHTDRSGGVTSYTYNAAGDQLTKTDPLGVTTTNTYDTLGRVTSTKRTAVVSGATVDYGTTTFTYNGLSQQVTVTEPAVVNPITSVTHTRVTTYSYDDSGRRWREVIADGSGGDAARTTTWAFDPAGRLTSITAPDGAVTTQEWNTAGDMWKTTRPGGLVLESTFDYAHRRLTTTATGSGVDPTNPAATSLPLEARGYDAVGRLQSVVDASGRRTTYAYYGDNLLQSVTREQTDPRPDIVTEQWEYDRAGHPTKLTAAGGIVTTWQYDDAANVTVEALDPTGLNRVSTHTYNADSTIDQTTATGAASGTRTEKVRYTYNVAGQVLTTTVDNTGSTPAQITTTRQRDPRGLVTRYTDPTGVATDIGYDVADRPITVLEAARTVWVNGVSSSVSPLSTRAYNTFGDVTQERDANGQTTTRVYDTLDRVTSVTMPGYTPPGGTLITATASTSYTALGTPQTETDALGNVTSYTYDKYGRVRTRTRPDPDGTGPKTAPVWTFSYTRSGELADTLDPIGAHNLATYDELGRTETTSTTERIGGVTTYFATTYGYNAAGFRTTVTSPMQHTTTTAYNNAGEPTRLTDPTGRFTEASRDLAGRVVATVAGQGTTYASPVQTMTWDLAGRSLSTSECTANTSTGACATVLRTRTTAYDAASRVTQEMSAAGRPTFYGYDTAGQLTSITQRVDPAQSSTAVTVSLGYDAAGNPTRTVDGRGNATISTYTPWNLLESVIEPSTTAHPATSNRTWTTVYDADGRAVQDKLPGGVTRTRTFDKLGRVTAETGAGATTAARSLDYDAVGRTVSASSPAGNLTFTWTDRGLLASANGYGGAATYTYDGEAKLTGRTDATGSVTFGYDDGGRLTSVVDPLTAATATIGYDPLGHPVSVGYGAGNASRVYTYDNLGRIATDTTKRPNNTVSASVTYGFDNDNLLTSKTTAGLSGAGANTYAYDGLSRVVSWLNPAGQTTTYGYDAASNRTSVTTPTGTRTSTFDQRNRITGTTGAGQPNDTYTWNARGQLTAATVNSQASTYTYDAFERLTQVARTGGTTTTYTYDSLDRPAQRNTAKFGYNDLTNNPILSPAAAGEAKLLRDPAGTVLSSKVGTGAGSLVLSDTLHGDVVATASATTGDPSASTSFGPWGTVTASSGSLPLGYQGGYTDPESGLTNAHARWYSPNLGAFTSRDTMTLAPRPLAQANRYLYANGSPLSGRDRDGHRFEADGGASPPPPPPAPTPSSGGGCAWTGDCKSVPQPVNDGGPTGRTRDEYRYVAPPPPPPPQPVPWYEKAWNFVEEHKAQIVGAVVGAVVGIGCGIAIGWTGVGAVACGVLAGAVGGLVTGAMEGHTGWALVADVGVGALIGGVVGGLSSIAGQAISAGVRGLLNGGVQSGMKALGQAAIKEAVNIGEGLVGGGRGLLSTVRGLLGGGARGAGEGVAEGAGGAAARDAAETATQDAAETAARDAGETATQHVVEPGGGPAACPNSFTPDTPVLLADGSSKPIGAIQLGDRVAATDPATGTTAAKPVTALHTNQDRALVDVTVTNPVTGTSSVVHTTDHHPFWNADTHQWTDAKDLKPGTHLLDADGRTAQLVTAVRTWTGLQEMDNLTVADTHTYYVLAGATSVLVHNCPTVDVYRFGSRTNPNELLPRITEAPESVQRSMAERMKDPAFLAMRGELHAEGYTERSPFVSLVRDTQRASETTDPWFQEIIANVPDIAHFRVPLNRLYVPDNELSRLETEVLFHGSDLADFLVGWAPNPFRST